MNASLGRKMELRPRLLMPPEQSFFLLGSRGTRESRGLGQVVPDALLVDLLGTNPLVVAAAHSGEALEAFASSERVPDRVRHAVVSTAR